MKKFSVKSIVAIGIGAALFFVLGRFVAIPCPVPNVNICVQYGLLAFMSVVYGPIAGALIGFIGHALIDFSYGWGVWWSWVIASGVFGLLVGLAAKILKMDEAEKKFFIQSLGGFLHKEETAPADNDLDWDELFRIAESQDLEAAFYYQCRPLLPEAIISCW